MAPLKINVRDNNLMIVWNDESKSIIKLANLRRYCPCAECDAENEKQSRTYIPIYSAKELHVKKIQLVGNYALGVTWEDDHNTGIYGYAYLKQLSEQLIN